MHHGLMVVEPVLPGLVPRVGDQPRAPVEHGGERLLGHAGHVAEPLRRDQRLDRLAAALAVAHVMDVVLDLDEITLLAQALDDPGARLETVEPGEAGAGVRGHPAVRSDDRDARQAVTPPHLEVVRIVERRDLHQARAELAVHRRIGDEGQPAADQRQDGRAALEVAIALVLRMQGHGGIAQQGLRPRRRHHDPLLAPLNGIGDVVELALNGLRLHLEVRDRRAERRRPVDHVLAAGDEPLAIETDEGLAHGAGEPRIHGEPLPAPIARGAQQVELVADVAVVLLLPLPHPLEELLPSQLLAARAFGEEMALHHELGGDAGMIGTGEPEGVVALHPAPAGQQVLQGGLQGVADVELAGDVGRRDHDAVRGPVRGRLGAEIVPLRPAPLPGLLVGRRVEALVHLDPGQHLGADIPLRLVHCGSFPFTKQKGAVICTAPRSPPAAPKAGATRPGLRARAAGRG